MPRVPVFAARTAEEEEQVESILEALKIPFDRRLDANEESDAVCHLSTFYDVEADDAPRSRDALRQAGLSAGLQLKTKS